MSGRIATGLSLIALVLGMAACGGDGSTTATETTGTVPTTETTETTRPETTKLRVYYFIDGYVQPVAREVPRTEAVAKAAFDAMLAGPTAAESELGMVNSVSSLPASSLVLKKNGVLRVSGGLRGLTEANLAQIVYTLTQFPTVKAVEIGGKRYTRSDFEDWTPIILVESPLPYEAVTDPFRVTGTANTFEATFQYEVVDPNGNVVAKDFVTATSGTGQRGTFDFMTKPFDSPPGTGALVVFEYSAKDGSRIHEVRIPVQLPG